MGCMENSQLILSSDWLLLTHKLCISIWRGNLSAGTASLTAFTNLQSLVIAGAAESEATWEPEDHVLVLTPKAIIALSALTALQKIVRYPSPCSIAKVNAVHCATCDEAQGRLAAMKIGSSCLRICGPCRHHVANHLILLPGAWRLRNTSSVQFRDIFIGAAGWEAQNWVNRGPTLLIQLECRTIVPHYLNRKWCPWVGLHDAGCPLSDIWSIWAQSQSAKSQGVCLLSSADRAEIKGSNKKSSHYKFGQGFYWWASIFAHLWPQTMNANKFTAWLAWRKMTIS